MINHFSLSMYDISIVFFCYSFLYFYTKIKKEFKEFLHSLTFRQTTPCRPPPINDSFFFAAGGMERAQLIFILSFNIAISNERVSLFAVLCVRCFAPFDKI